MLRLNSQDPVTVELPGGAKIHFEAANPRIVAAGRRRVREHLELETEDALEGDLRDESIVLFTQGCALAAATGWEGIGGPDGKALPFNKANLRAALEDTLVFNRVDTEYVQPIMERELEKNGSAASSAGTTSKATAESGTASNRAPTTPDSKPKKAGRRKPSSGANSKPTPRKKTAPKKK